MPFDGSGNYTPPSPPVFPAVASELIRADYFNAVINDLAEALGQALTRDGQSSLDADLPAGGHKITGLADGTAPADTATFGQLSPVLGNKNLGTLASGSVNPWEVSKTASQGAADGTSQLYSFVNRVYAQGANNYDNVRGQYLGTHVNTTGGTVALADGLHAYVWQAGAGSITNVQVVAAHVRIDGAGDVTNEAICFRCVSTTLGASATIATVKGLSIGDIGDATKVTNVYGVEIPDLAASSVAIGVRSLMNSGANKYFLFGAGTAQSAHNGHFGIGITNVPLWKLTVRESASTFVADFGNTHASAPFGVRIQYTAAAPNGSDNAFITCQDTGGTRFQVLSNGTVNINGTRVLNSRQTGCPAAATDLATVITLANFLRTALITHGLVS